MPREIDEQKIADALGQLYTDATRGYSSSPACLVIADSGKVETKQYYKIEDHIRDVRYTSDDDYVEEGRSLLENLR